MPIVTDFGADVQSYLAHFDTQIFPRPAVCPHCQASGTLIGHGFYGRQPTDGEHDYRIQIKRMSYAARLRVQACAARGIG